MALKFLQNLFNRKEEAQPAAQPAAPVAAEPAAPVPEAPVQPDDAASDDIRMALDEAAQLLIGSDKEAARDVGDRLMGLKMYVADQPCTFAGFDEIITKAIGQIEYFCRTTRGDFATINQHVDMIEAAISARTLTRDSVRKFQPTMETHYYKMLLIDLQGRLNKLLLDIEQKKRWIAEKQALPMHEQIGYQQTIMAFTTSITSSQMALTTLRQQIGTYQGGLFAAQQALDYDGPLPEIDIATVLGPIYEQATQFEQSMEAMQRSITAFNVMHAAHAEQQLLAAAQASAAQKMHEKQMAEAQQLTDMAARSIAEVTGQTVEAMMTPATTPESAPAAEIPEAELPELPNVFTDDFRSDMGMMSI